MSTMSPNMNMPISTVGVDTGTTWEQNLNASLSILDGHDHTPGKGVPITPSGLNINAPVDFQNQQAINLMGVKFTPQLSDLTLNEVYVQGVDLYYNDSNGNVIQLTASGSVNATSSGISDGTATASFVAGVLVVNSAPLTPANIQVGSVKLGNNVASSKFLTLSPPNAMAADYTLTLPSLPGVTSFVTLDTSGNFAAATTIDGTTIVNNAGVLSATAGIPDNVSIQVSSGVLSAKNTEFTYEFKLNGNYGSLSTPVTQVDGLCFFNYNVTIVNAWAWIRSAGSAGTTEVDLKVITAPGGSGTSIYSTTPKFASTAGASAYADATGVVSPGTGVTAGVLGTTAIAAGSALRFDLITAMTNPDSVGITVIFKQR